MREHTYTSAWDALTASHPATSARWVRLPAAPWGVVSGRAGGADVALWPLAVEPRGRRREDAPLVDAGAIAALQRERRGGRALVPILDHAGPEAGRFSPERPLGPAAVPAPTSGRTPLPLDGEGWADVRERYRESAARLVDSGVPLALVSVDDDGLLACTLSPRANPGRPIAERLAPVIDIVGVVIDAGLDVAVGLTVEELCPSGLDATDGIAAARALVDAGARLLVASGGSEALPVLKHRTDARGPDDVWLASAGWLVGRVAAPVVAQGPCVDAGRARAGAVALGLAGVIDAREVAP